MARTPSVVGGIFDQMPGDADVAVRLSDEAFIGHVVRFEAAVAQVQGAAGVIPADAAAAIVSSCHRFVPEIERIAVAAAMSATPVIEIVRQVRATLAPDVAEHFHRGLTSQDCIDTALQLMQADVLDVIGPRIAVVVGKLSRLAEAHASTPMLARTLGQAAAPTTFGWKVCGWIAGLESAVALLADVRDALAVQVGGAVGDLANLGPEPMQLVGQIADLLDLSAPRGPWHTDRSRILQAAAAYTQLLNACAKIGLDVMSMTGQDVGELMLGRDARQAQRGGSSAMPHKRNPAAAVLLRSAAVQASGLLGTIAASGVHEHERGAGTWQAEWRPLRELLRLSGGATAELDLLVADIDVVVDRMARNLRSADVGVDTSAAQQRCGEFLARFGK